VFARRQDWQLVLGLGGRPAPESLADLPANVTALGWAPQIEVLAEADCAIEHGGISGANECVRQRVPLLFYDGGQIDQPGVVARLVHHGVAIRGDAQRDDALAIEQRIAALCESEEIRGQLERFSDRMMQHEQEHTAAVQVERVIGEVTAAAGS
jgi:UDP:flavonoid glycosyltransferase YjiC (YdhE family)